MSAVINVINAFTQVNDEDYKMQLMKSLACVEKHHDFEDTHVLFEASARLSMLTMEDDEVVDNDEFEAANNIRY